MAVHSCTHCFMYSRCWRGECSFKTVICIRTNYLWQWKVPKCICLQVCSECCLIQLYSSTQPFVAWLEPYFFCQTCCLLCMNVTKRFATLWPELQAFAIPILIFELLKQLNKMKCIWLGVLYYTGYPDCLLQAFWQVVIQDNTVQWQHYITRHSSYFPVVIQHVM